MRCRCDVGVDLASDSDADAGAGAGAVLIRQGFGAADFRVKVTARAAIIRAQEIR